MKKLVIGVSVLTLFGCATEAEHVESPPSVIELTYWPAPNQQEVQLADSLVRKWNRLHSRIRVRMQPIPVSQSTEEVLLAAMAGETTPDVCSNIWPGALYEYTRAGGLVALDRFPDFDSVVSSRMPSELLLGFQSEDGHVYQMPWKTNPVMMFYNKRLLREAGVAEVPRTYSQYLAAGMKVTRDRDGDGQIDVWMGDRDIRPIWWQRLFDFYPLYVASTGGRTLFENSSVAFENSHGEQVLAFIQACYAKALFPRTFFQGGDPFLLEKKATHFSGPWEIAAIEKFAPQMEYGVVPLPVPDDHQGPVYTYGDFKNIAIFANTKHPREAWEFVKFLVQSEHDLLLLEICNQIPVRDDLNENPLFGPYFARRPTMRAFAQQARYTRGVDAAPDLKEILDAIAQEYEACAVYSAKTPAEAIHAAARRTKMILEWNK